MKSRVLALAVAWSIAGGIALGQRPDADLCAVPPGEHFDTWILQ
jgi:hypothetical protein